MALKGLMKRVENILFYIAIAIIALFFLYPIIFMITTAFKFPLDAFAIPPKFIFDPTFIGFEALLDPMAAQRRISSWGGLYIPPIPGGSFVGYFFNSLVVATGSTTLSVLLGCMAGYGFSRYRAKVSGTLMMFVIGLRFLPPIAIIIPYWLVMGMVGLLDTWAALILAHTVLNVPFISWMMWGFFQDVPEDLDHAAQVDGCSEISVLWRIILPVVGPAVVAVSVLAFIWSWNEFLFAMVLTSMKAKTLPILIGSYIDTEEGTLWPFMCAASTVVTIPVLVFTMITQKYMVKGLMFGAVKG